MPTDGDRALAELRAELDGLPEAALLRPSADPHAGAVTALLVADYLGRGELQSKVEAVGLAEADVTQLRRLARALLCVVARLGGDYLPNTRTIPADVTERANAVRAQITSALEKALPDDAEVMRWLEAIRLGTGLVDLVYDLRTLGELCKKHLDGKKEGPLNATAAAVLMAGASADAVEFALRMHDSKLDATSRDTLSRLWTLFVPAYERAAAAGRELTRESGRERHFPPLAMVAAHRRARRRPLSVVERASLPPAEVPAVTEAEVSDLSDSLVEDEAPDASDGAEGETVEITRSEPPAPPPARVSLAPSARTSAPPSESRRRVRSTVEIEVGVASESNFYLGFTENLSSGGVFVATYSLRPIGSGIEVALTFPSGEELRVRGTVRWLREATNDGWPGMGVQFDGLTPDEEAKVRKFLSLRDPLFYDE